MDLFRKTPKIDFLRQRYFWAVFSGVLMLVSVISLGVRGLNLGIDFTGGTLVEVGYPQPANLDQVRSVLAGAGFHDVTVQYFGTVHDVLMRLAPEKELSKAELSTRLLRALRGAGGQNVEVRRVEFVGPQVGRELAERGGLAMLVVMGAILIYVALRFEYRFAIGAIAALAHDPIITLGVFSLFGLEFDLTVLAAILAVIGYSLNDTIVVFDRIRENFRKMRKVDPVTVANASINQTLSRTLMTAFTTLLVLIALLVFGGELIRGFSIALIVGIVVGTYSSIYVASAAALALGVSKADLMPVKKEGSEVDARP
jgi:preprotein translocase subunit SecF